MVRQYAVVINGESRSVSVEELGEGRVRVIVDGREQTLDVRGSGVRLTWLDGTTVVTAEVEAAAGGKVAVSSRGELVLVEVKDASAQRLAQTARSLVGSPAGPTRVRSNIPGRLVKLLVRAGDVVKAGAGLVVIEAMKMENEIRAPRDGVIKEICVAEGVAVEAGQDLVVLE